MNSPNLQIIRDDTPGCSNKVFLNSAGASLMPKIVVEKMTNYLREEEKVGGYELAKQESNSILAFYIEAAKLLNTKPDNIAFTYNATDSYARALSSIPFKASDYILTTQNEYSSNQIAFLGLQKRFGIQIAKSRNLSNGDLDLEHFEELIRSLNPVLVAITHIPSNAGTIQPASVIGKLCKKYNVWYLLDACQSLGQIKVDVHEIGCDFLTATGRKFLRGPRGTGLLYLSDRVIKEGLEPLIMDIHGADWVGFDQYRAQMNAKRFEIWEFSHSCLIGFTAAIKYLNDLGIDYIEHRNKRLMDLLRKNLQNSNTIRILDKGSQQSNIINVDIPTLNIDHIEFVLKKNKIYYSVSEHNLSFRDLSKMETEKAIRLSPHYFNTEQEIEIITEILTNISLEKNLLKKNLSNTFIA